MSSCRATTTLTVSPCLVLRSMATSSSWLRPAMSFPFTCAQRAYTYIYIHTHTQTQYIRIHIHIYILIDTHIHTHRCVCAIKCDDTACFSCWTHPQRWHLRFLVPQGLLYMTLSTTQCKVQQFSQWGGGCRRTQFPAANGCWHSVPSVCWHTPYLQDAVSGLQAAIFDCSATRQDVLHQDRARPVDRRVPGYHGEAQTLCACVEEHTCITACAFGGESVSS